MATEPAPQPAPPVRLRWRVAPDEIPPEFVDNSIVQTLTRLTPEDERVLEHLADLDRRDP